MEITEDLAYSLMLRFVRSYLACDDISIGKLSGLPVVKPNKSAISKGIIKIGIPLLLIDKSTRLLDKLFRKGSTDLYWTKVLTTCLGKRISWYDSYKSGKSAIMPKTIEQLIIELDLIA